MLYNMEKGEIEADAQQAVKVFRRAMKQPELELRIVRDAVGCLTVHYPGSELG